MAFEMDCPESFDQEGDRLREPGKYHVVVLGLEENPTNKDGKLIDNAVFRASLAVLDGTAPGQKDKQIDLLFFGPKMTHKDRGEMARKKIWFFAQSIGCGELVSGKMRLDFSQAAGRQCVADIEITDSKYTDASGAERVTHNPNIKFCNIYHVDDPRVKDVPKDAASISLLPLSLRKEAKDFNPASTGQQNGTTQAAKPTAQPATPPPPPAATEVNLDDL
jgi:hypothetical protein